jgi:uncharacterized protein YuzE/transcriptional regulator with XRE-family HTH domain
MRIRYDADSRGLLIAFADAKHYAESQEVAPGVVVDFDRKGRALAIELEDVAAVTNPSAVLDIVAPQIRNGADLRKFRDALSMSQQGLGDALGVPRNTVARWERDAMLIERPLMLSLALRGLVSDDARGEILSAVQAMKSKPANELLPARREPRHKRRRSAARKKH